MSLALVGTKVFKALGSNVQGPLNRWEKLAAAAASAKPKADWLRANGQVQQAMALDTWRTGATKIATVGAMTPSPYIGSAIKGTQAILGPGSQGDVQAAFQAYHKGVSKAVPSGASGQEAVIAAIETAARDIKGTIAINSDSLRQFVHQATRR